MNILETSGIWSHKDIIITGLNLKSWNLTLPWIYWMASWHVREYPAVVPHQTQAETLILIRHLWEP